MASLKKMMKIISTLVFRLSVISKFNSLFRYPDFISLIFLLSIFFCHLFSCDYPPINIFILFIIFTMTFYPLTIVWGNLFFQNRFWFFYLFYFLNFSGNSWTHLILWFKGSSDLIRDTYVSLFVFNSKNDILTSVPSFFSIYTFSSSSSYSP